MNEGGHTLNVFVGITQMRMRGMGRIVSHVGGLLAYINRAKYRGMSGKRGFSNSHHIHLPKSMGLHKACNTLILFPSPEGRGVRGEGGNLCIIMGLAMKHSTFMIERLGQ
jgi:hypothetical protein